MRAWAFMLGGPLLWAAHFFLLYAIASIFLTTMTARILVGIVSLVLVAADAALLQRSLAARQAGGDDRFGRWMASLAALGAALAMVAIVWQTLPALLA